MKIVKTGEKSKGACDHCREVVSTTFQLRSVPFESGGIVDNLLSACCDRCDRIVAIPHQSTPRIKEFLNSKRCSVEMRLPRHLIDILILTVDKLTGSEPDRLKDTLVRYYIGLAHDEKVMIKKIKKLALSGLVEGEIDSRLSLKVNPIVQEQLDTLCELTSLNKTQFLKGLILQINDDILQKKVKSRIKEVSKVLLACS